MRPALFVFASIALAQSIPPDEIRSKTTTYTPPQLTLRTEVRVVEVPVVVRDPQHRTVAGLTKGDFEISDDGKKQQITAFSVRSSAAPATAAEARPRFLALNFDDLHLSFADLKRAKDAAERFVKTSLVPGDRVAIVATSKSAKSVFTADIPTLVEQIGQITSVPQPASYTSQSCVRLTPYEAYQLAEQMDPGGALLQAKVGECSACYHAACHEGMITGTAKAVWADNRVATAGVLGQLNTLVDGMAKLPGQRTILLTSAGFLTGTLQADVDKLTDTARHAEVVINVLDSRGVSSAGTPYDGMAALADGTGGTFFHNQNNLEDGFRELGMAPETVYLLAFTPSSAPDGHFHKLKVQLAKKYSVQSRQGYLAIAASPEPLSKLDAAVSSSNTIADLPVTFTWEQWAGPPGITLIAHLDLTHMQFKPYQDRRTQRLTIVAILRDAQGAIVTGKRSELELSLKDATLAQFDKAPFSVALTLNAQPGTYTARAVAQDALESAQSAASTPIEIK
jgi:VWFA-related protein